MKYGLLQCWPVGNGSANRQLAECDAANKTDAVENLQPHCPVGVTLDATGYTKVGEVSYVVAEEFGS